jgi:peptidoglycan L-alanyl-D-glutamate endopeptidase CwlK
VSSRNLDDLRPEIRPQVDAFLAACAAAGVDVLVTCTLRSNEEQAALYAKGRTTAPIGRRYVVTDAPAGKSAHNFGLAIDIVPMVGGKPDWRGADPVWQQVGKLGVAAGLEWAGEPGFPFPEEPHFQHPTWRSLAGIA